MDEDLERQTSDIWLGSVVPVATWPILATELRSPGENVAIAVSAAETAAGDRMVETHIVPDLTVARTPLHLSPMLEDLDTGTRTGVDDD